MDLRLLEDFLSLTQTGSFSRSAEERRITQPAFSRRIQNLESWIGTPLVNRASYPTTLTPAGIIFQRTAADILQRVGAARKEIADATCNSDVVSVSVVHSLSMTFVPRWLRELETKIGPAKCRFISDNMHSCVRAMSQGDVDFLLCFVYRGSDEILDCDRFPMIGLGSDKIVPVSVPVAGGTAPAFSLPGSSGSPCRLLAYSSQTYLGRIIEEFLYTRLSDPHVTRVYENSFTEALKAAALAGHGFAWLPAQSVTEELAQGRLVRAGAQEWDLDVEIRLYRSAGRTRPQVEKIWRSCASAGEVRANYA